MSNAIADTGQGSALDVENLDQMAAEFDERMQEDASATPAGQPETPAEPVAAASTPAPSPPPEAPKPGAWRDAVLDDVEHGFFKGKPAKQLYESYTNLEHELQRVGTRTNAAERRVQELEGELAQTRQPKPQAAQPSAQQTDAVPNPENDPVIAEANKVWYDDPTRAAQLLLDRARATAADDYKANRLAERNSEGWEQLKSDSAQATRAAVQHAMTLYGWTVEQAAARIRSTFPDIADHEANLGPTIWANTNNYLWGLEKLYGAPPSRTDEPPAAPPAPAALTPDPTTQLPDIANPPGSRKPVPAAPRTTQPSALTREEEATRRALARQMGLDPDQVMSVANRRAEGGRTRAQ